MGYKEKASYKPFNKNPAMKSQHQFMFLSAEGGSFMMVLVISSLLAIMFVHAAVVDTDALDLIRSKHWNLV